MLARDMLMSYVGAVVGHVEQHFFNPAIMGIEDAWFVREGTRTVLQSAWVSCMGSWTGASTRSKRCRCSLVTSRTLTLSV
jgi:hypothetical protein